MPNSKVKKDGVMSEASLRGVDLNNIGWKDETRKRINNKPVSEEEKTRPHFTGEQSAVGTAPNPQQIHQKTVLERAQKSSLYDDATEENPEELDVTTGYDDKKDLEEER